MLLHLGNKPTLVVSSATAAEYIMKTHDLIFANRPNLRFFKRLFYNDNDVAFSSHSENWKHMKAICVAKALNDKRVQSYRTIREEEIGCVIETIKGYNGSVINMSETFVKLFKDVICRTTLGRKYNTGDNFYKVVKELMKVMGETSLGDYVPYLGWVDKLSGLEGRVENVRRWLDKFIEEVIQEHQIQYNDNIKDIHVKDFVDILLEIQQEKPEELSTEGIKALILDMFVAGVDTKLTVVIWAMTELVRNPRIMKKAQQEVRSIVKGNTRVTEDDLKNLNYLKAVIKETLRLHIPAPLLIFRESSQNVKIDKFDIIAGTRVIINAWAIHVDPESWHDPEEFIPERFLNNSPSIDFKGQHFQFLPFGAGRRGCPGIAYAITNVELVLASLVYEFDWKLPDGREGGTLDVKESSGITVGRQNPLMLIATPSTSHSCH